MDWLMLRIVALLTALTGVLSPRRRSVISKPEAKRQRVLYAPIDATRMMPPNSSEKMMELARAYVARHNRLIDEIGKSAPTPEVAQAVRVMRQKLAALCQIATESNENARQISFADSRVIATSSGIVDRVTVTAPLPTPSTSQFAEDRGDRKTLGSPGILTAYLPCGLQLLFDLITLTEATNGQDGEWTFSQFRATDVTITPSLHIAGCDPQDVHFAPPRCPTVSTKTLARSFLT